MKRLVAVLALTITSLAVGTAGASAVGPTIVSPIAGAHTGANGQINVHYTLPDVPSNPVVIQFTREAPGFPVTTLEVSSQSTDVDLTFSAASPTSNLSISSATGPITDGLYFVTVEYFSDAQGAMVSTTHYNVRVDSTTSPPTLLSPSSSSSVAQIPVTFVLPEEMTLGSTHLVFSGASDCDLRLVDEPHGEQVSFTINPASIASSSGVAEVGSGCELPDGTYTVALSYQDVYGNPAATTISSNVKIDTVTDAPTLVSPAASDQFLNRIAVDYDLPEAALAASVKLTFVGDVTRAISLSGESQGEHGFTFDPLAPTDESEITGISGGTTLPSGLYSVTLSYQDAVGNPVASAAAATSVRVGPPPDTQPPAKPTGLVASSITQTSATLDWSAATDNVGVVSYNAFKDGVLFVTTANTTAGITLKCGETSHFAISAVDAAGNESAHSVVLDVTGATCDVPFAPIGPPAATPKVCFTAPKKVSYKGKVKKKKFTVSLAGTPSPDGQRIQVTLSAPKSVKVTLTSNGKAVKGPKIWITLTDGAQNVAAKIRNPGGTSIKPVKLTLPKEAC